MKFNVTDPPHHKLFLDPRPDGGFDAVLIEADGTRHPSFVADSITIYGPERRPLVTVSFGPPTEHGIFAPDEPEPHVVG